MARFFQGFHNEFAAWKPERFKGTHDPEIGAIAVEFEAFSPGEKFAKAPKVNDHHEYPMVVPRADSQLPPLDPILKALVETLWKRAEPAAGATRGAIQIGGRGNQVTPQRDAYATQTRGMGKVDFSNTGNLARTNAITMRGDTRGPHAVIIGNGKSGGFNPPNTRTDDYYIYGAVFNAFKGYMKYRFNVDITMADFVSAMAGSAPSAAAKHVLADYMMYRCVMESEALNIGAMVSSELVKAYISTSRSLMMARQFAHRYGAVANGWIYVCHVRGGFVIPKKGLVWGTTEQEIAQLGPIVPADIVGFHKSAWNAGADPYWAGGGPIYFRRSFRKKEPEAFRRMFDMLSGWAP